MKEKRKKTLRGLIEEEMFRDNRDRKERTKRAKGNYVRLFNVN